MGGPRSGPREFGLPGPVAPIGTAGRRPTGIVGRLHDRHRTIPAGVGLYSPNNISNELRSDDRTCEVLGNRTGGGRWRVVRRRRMLHPRGSGDTGSPTCVDASQNSWAGSHLASCAGLVPSSPTLTPRPAQAHLRTRGPDPDLSGGRRRRTGAAGTVAPHRGSIRPAISNTVIRTPILDTHLLLQTVATPASADPPRRWPSTSPGSHQPASPRVGRDRSACGSPTFAGPLTATSEGAFGAVPGVGGYRTLVPRNRDPVAHAAYRTRRTHGTGHGSGAMMAAVTLYTAGCMGNPTRCSCLRTFWPSSRWASHHRVAVDGADRTALSRNAGSSSITSSS